MANIQDKIMRFLIKKQGVKRVFASNEQELKRYILEEVRQKPFVEPSKKLQKKCQIVRRKINSQVYYVFAPKDTDTKRAIIYIHGGGFFMEISAQHWNFVAEIACQSNAVVYVPIYPLTPEHSCKETYEMLMALYQEVIAPTKPSSFHVAGDSAGGGIALSFAMLLREKNLPQPDQILLLSPGLRLNEMTKEEIETMNQIDKKDPVLSPASLKSIAKWWSGELDPSHYLVSPGCGSLQGLGSISVFTSSDDILSVYCESLRQKAEEEHVEIDYNYQPDQIHCYVLLNSKGNKAVREKILAILSQ